MVSPGRTLRSARPVETTARRVMNITRRKYNFQTSKVYLTRSKTPFHCRCQIQINCILAGTSNETQFRWIFAWDFWKISHRKLCQRIFNTEVWQLTGFHRPIDFISIVIFSYLFIYQIYFFVCPVRLLLSFVTYWLINLFFFLLCAVLMLLICRQ